MRPGVPSPVSFHDLAMSFTPYNTRGSETSHPKPLMTAGFLSDLRSWRLVGLRRGHAQNDSSSGRRGALLPPTLANDKRRRTQEEGAGPRETPAWSVIGAALGFASSRASGIVHHSPPP